MQIWDIVEELEEWGISVMVRKTQELFPSFENVIEPSYSLVCASEEDMERVHHWIQFAKPLFDGFYVRSAYMITIN